MRHAKHITSLRALAVAAVVLFHANLFGATGGFVGVDVFFVLSGYLMSALYAPQMLAQNFTLQNFFYKRIRRILPLALFVVFITLLASYFVSTPQNFQNTTLFSMMATFFTSNYANIHFSGGYFDEASSHQPLLHYWSLAVEEQFYLLFAILLFVLQMFKKNRNWFLVILILLIAASFTHSLILPQKESYYLLSTRAWELAAGALLGLYHAPHQQPKTSQSQAIILQATALILIIAPIFIFNAQTSFPGPFAIFPVLGALLFIRYGGVTTQIHKMMTKSGFVLMGTLSYGIYLWHLPILALQRHYFAPESLNSFQILASLILIFFLSYATHKLIETPFQKRFPPLKNTLSIIAASFTALLLSAYIFSTQGLPGRYGDIWEITQNTIQNKYGKYEPCHLQEINSKECRIGNDTTKIVFALIGDSNAAAPAETFDKIAKQEGISGTLYWRAGCAPLFGYERTGKNCQSPFVQAITDLPETVKTVFLFGRWPLVVEEEGLSKDDEPSDEPSYHKIGETTPFPGDQTLRNGLTNTIELLKEKDINVVIIFPTPELGFHPLEKILREPDTQPTKDRRLVDKRQHETLEILSQILEDTKSSYISPLSKLCTAQECKTREGDLLIYMDDDHLSPEGAAYVFSDDIEAYLKQNSPKKKTDIKPLTRREPLFYAKE